MKIFIIIISCFLFIGLSAWILGLIARGKFTKRVNQLFILGERSSDRIYHVAQLQPLPSPVQRYFRHVLKDGQPYIDYARITHDGKFKPGVDKDWLNIKGEQYATTQVPGFIWKGTTTLFTAQDMFIADRGQLVVTLLALVNVVNAQGPEFDQGELLRWFGESVLYPTNFLPSDRVSWTAIDEHSATVTLRYKHFELAFKVTFNQSGEIIELETKRYMDKTRLETWIIKCGPYKEFNNVLVPISFDVIWRLSTGDLSYARFRIKKVEYNIPDLF